VSWIQVVLDFIRQFFPFEIVHEYQSGVRFWCGHAGKELPPGLYMFVPYFGSVYIEQVKPDIIRLYKQNVTTKDGIGLMISANVRYEIVSLRKCVINVQDHKDNLSDEGRTAISRVVREKTYDELVSQQKAIETEIRGTMADVVNDWGVKIWRVSFVDLIRTKSIALANLQQ
jgi:regulator of protease activity HflC (stomatin/prohibitin superfamily)